MAIKFDEFKRVVRWGLALGLCIGSATRAGAQTRGSSANSELLLADSQTVLTASKSVQRISDSPSAVTILTEQQINDSGAANLLDILRYAAGVSVVDQNSSVANVSIRGFTTQFANTILVMVDGRSIYQDYYGGVLWHSTPLLISRIKRIEIVRGPGSALYGANAFNGIINIITKTPAELAKAGGKSTFRLLTGERNTQNLELQTTGGNPGDWSFSFGAAYNHSDGRGGTAPTRTFYDAYSTPVLTFDAEKRTPQGSLRFAAGNTETTADHVEAFRFPDVHGHYNYLSLTYAEDRAKSPLLARVYADFSKAGGAGSVLTKTQAVDAEVQQTRRLSRSNSLIYGGSFRSITAQSDITKSPQSDINERLFGLYLQDEWQLARRTMLFAGVRFDNHSLYGSNTSPRLSLVHHLSPSQTVRVSYGRAFRAPTISDGYTDFTTPTSPQTNLHIQSNRDLNPEHVSTVEIGWRSEHRRNTLAASLYYSSVTDEIGDEVTLYPSPPYPPFTPSATRRANAGGSTTFGYELEAEATLARNLRGLANYSYQDSRTSLQSLFGQLAPKHKVNLSLTYQFAPHWDAFVGAHFVGGNNAHITGAVYYLRPYTRIDTRIGYHFGTHNRPYVLSLVATDLFDSQHFEYPNTGAKETSRQGRTVYLALTGGF